MSMDSERVKPPLGVKPRVLWLEERVNDLFHAVQQRLEVGFEVSEPIIGEWVGEIHEICQQLRETRKKNGS